MVTVGTFSMAWISIIGDDQRGSGEPGSAPTARLDWSGGRVAQRLDSRLRLRLGEEAGGRWGSRKERERVGRGRQRKVGNI